ncbi:MAG TPA: hypothetical protein VL287_11290 [Gemmatimonadales bacterium]|jgi:hypothetical protein|nr:hypothetical protein [Gemmatimonadales bacterium]
MTVHDPFDHRPDATIGGLLRDHLRVDDHEAFVVRMKAAARRGLRGARTASVREWDLLAGWFRPGMAAAVAILLGALLGVGRGERHSGVQFAEALGPTEAPAEFLAAEVPDPQVLLSPLLEEQ